MGSLSVVFTNTYLVLAQLHVPVILRNIKFNGGSNAVVYVQNSDNVNARLNQTINSKNRLNGGIAYQGSDNTTPNITPPLGICS